MVFDQQGECWLTSNQSDLPTTSRNVTFQGRIVNVGTFPIGIQPERFAQTVAETKVQERIAALEREFKGRKLMVGVDRLDYVKGLPQKLRALEVLLTNHPELVGSVVLVQIAIPTRGEVEEYQNLRVLVNELVGRINGKFGKPPLFWPFLSGTAHVLTFSSSRNNRVYTNSFHASIYGFRGVVGSLRYVGCLRHCINPRWDEPGIL